MHTVQVPDGVERAYKYRIVCMSGAGRDDLGCVSQRIAAYYSQDIFKIENDARYNLIITTSR